MPKTSKTKQVKKEIVKKVKVDKKVEKKTVKKDSKKQTAKKETKTVKKEVKKANVKKTAIKDTKTKKSKTKSAKVPAEKKKSSVENISKSSVEPNEIIVDDEFFNDETKEVRVEYPKNKTDERIDNIRENNFAIQAKRLEDIIDVGMAAYDNDDYKKKLLKAFEKSYKNLETDVGKDTAKDLLAGLQTGALLDNYSGDNDDKINEALVMIVQDEDVSDDVKEKTIMKLIRRNVGMIHRCINIFQAGVNGKDDGKISNEDLQQEAQIAFIRAIKTYNLNREDRTKFSSYCYRVIYNAFSSLFTDKINKRRRNETSLDATLTNDSDEKDAALEDFIADEKQKSPEELVMENDRNVIIRQAIRKLTPTQRFLAYTRFGLNDSDKITQVDIAEFLDVSQANISKAETGMLQSLKSILAEMGLTGADLFKEYD